jgi:hypothetical protein
MRSGRNIVVKKSPKRKNLGISVVDSRLILKQIPKIRYMTWTQLARDRIHKRNFMNTLMNIQIP